MTRPPLEQVMMETALIWAKRGTCLRALVGAVLADRDGVIVAVGYNGAPHGHDHCSDVNCIVDADSHCIRSLHAEENVIIHCARSGRSTIDTTLYTTHLPCPRCCLKIIQAGIRKIVYYQFYGSREDQSRSIETLRRGGIEYSIFIRGSE